MKVDIGEVIIKLTSTTKYLCSAVAIILLIACFPDLFDTLGHLDFFCSRLFDAAETSQPLCPDITLFTYLQQVQGTIKQHMTQIQVKNCHEGYMYNIPELNHQHGNTEVAKVKAGNHLTASGGGNISYESS